MMFDANAYSSARSMGFIDDTEASFLSMLVARTYSEVGVIIDGGSFLGRSTNAICAGIEARDQDLSINRSRPIISIDRFRAVDKYIIEAFRRHRIDIERGESFLPLFLSNTDRYRELIEVRCGNVTAVGRIQGPIELAFIDIAKTRQINNYIISEWLPRLIEGASRIYYQDLHSPSFPWLAVSMGCLVDCFEIETECVGEGAVFRLRKVLSPDLVEKALSVEVLSEAGIASIEALMGRFQKPSSTLLLMQSLILAKMGDTARARLRFEQAACSTEENMPAKWQRWSTAVAVAVGINA